MRSQHSRSQHSLIIGTYTEDLPHVSGRALGVLGAAYDPQAATIGPVTVLARCRNPSFAAVSADGASVYVVNETTGPGGGGITAFARAPDGALRQLSFRPSGGEAPCHLAVDRTGRVLLVANYESGSVTAVPIEPAGSLGAGAGRAQHAGSSVHPDRQAGPHVHMACPDPVTGDVLVCDLGLDAVLTYQLTAPGQLTVPGLVERPAARITAPPGAGPRHLAFHPDGRHLFVVCELNSTVLVLRRAGDRFVLAGVTGTVPPGPAAGDSAAPGTVPPGPAAGDSAAPGTVPPGPVADGAAAGNLAGAIRVTPSGRHVLVSNRGHDTVAMLRFEPEVPALSLVHLHPSGGRGPRDLCLTPEGDRLVVANTGSHSLTVLAIDEDQPELVPVSETPAPSPCSVTFAPDSAG